MLARELLVAEGLDVFSSAIDSRRTARTLVLIVVMGPDESVVGVISIRRVPELRQVEQADHWMGDRIAPAYGRLRNDELDQMR